MKRKWLFIPLILVLSILLCYGAMRLNAYSHRNDWKEYTTPLPKENVNILCDSFELPSDHQLCDSKQQVYGPDFYELIRERFRPSIEYRSPNDTPATYDEVMNMIGRFETECEDVVWIQSKGHYTFRCFYDLRGDSVFEIGITFLYPENTVYKIVTPLSYDD